MAGSSLRSKALWIELIKADFPEPNIPKNTMFIKHPSISPSRASWNVSYFRCCNQVLLYVAMKSHLLATPWLISTKYADPNRTSYRYNSVSEGDIVATSPYIFTQSLHGFDRRIMWPHLLISEKTQFTFSLVNSCPLKCNEETSWNWNWCIFFKIFFVCSHNCWN